MENNPVRSLVQIVFDKRDMSIELQADEKLLDHEIIELLEDALTNFKMRSRNQIGEYLQ